MGKKIILFALLCLFVAGCAQNRAILKPINVKARENLENMNKNVGKLMKYFPLLVEKLYEVKLVQELNKYDLSEQRLKDEKMGGDIVIENKHKQITQKISEEKEETLKYVNSLIGEIKLQGKTALDFMKGYDYYAESEKFKIEQLQINQLMSNADIKQIVLEVLKDYFTKENVQRAENSLKELMEIKIK
jgi:hypothetical protein